MSYVPVIDVMVRYFFLVYFMALSACSLIEPTGNESIGSEQKAAVRFLSPVFPLLDCEHVGEIETGEVDEHFSQMYFFVDRDMSRSVTEAEFLRSMPRPDPDKDRQIFKLMDTNLDTLVTPMEFRRYSYKAIKQADADNSGSVSRREVGLKPLK